MRRSRAEKTQPGNPHELSKRQHVFPRRSIERFCDNGRVDLIDVVREKRRSARPTDPAFCADRVWNHGAETGFMKEIEDAFQALASSVIASPELLLSAEQIAVINDFYGLWRSRAERRYLPTQRIGATGTLGTRVQYSQDDLERLEKHNIIGVAPDGSFAMRDFMGSVIQLAIDDYNELLGREPWGIIQAEEGEFCVPDKPMKTVIPISPNVSLVRGAPNQIAQRSEVARINLAVADEAREYCFARNLVNCPGLLQSRLRNLIV